MGEKHVSRLEWINGNTRSSLNLINGIQQTLTITTIAIIRQTLDSNGDSDNKENHSFTSFTFHLKKF